uniref:Uncharacterized protein n=1 Tax=Panagrolaimus sp. JU765 TaxID=591449 RepID=A0AC34RTC5_9BILA
MITLHKNLITMMIAAVVSFLITGAGIYFGSKIVFANDEVSCNINIFAIYFHGMNFNSGDTCKMVLFFTQLSNTILMMTGPFTVAFFERCTTFNTDYQDFK